MVHISQHQMRIPTIHVSSLMSETKIFNNSEITRNMQKSKIYIQNQKNKTYNQKLGKESKLCKVLLSIYFNIRYTYKYDLSHVSILHYVIRGNKHFYKK